MSSGRPQTLAFELSQRFPDQNLTKSFARFNPFVTAYGSRQVFLSFQLGNLERKLRVTMILICSYFLSKEVKVALPVILFAVGFKFLNI